jgi:hypothetical protein
MLHKAGVLCNMLYATCLIGRIFAPLQNGKGLIRGSGYKDERTPLALHKPLLFSLSQSFSTPIASSIASFLSCWPELHIYTLAIAITPSPSRYYPQLPNIRRQSPFLEVTYLFQRPTTKDFPLTAPNSNPPSPQKLLQWPPTTTHAATVTASRHGLRRWTNLPRLASLAQARTRTQQGV